MGGTFCKQNCRNIHIFKSYELLFKYLFEIYVLTKLLMTKILHGCLDGLELCHQMIKTMLEYVRSGDYLTHPPRKHFHSRTHICQLQLQQAPANLFVKASVCYFFRNFHFSPNGCSSKTMKDVFHFIWKTLFILEIFKFLYFSPCQPFLESLIQDKS